jgi:hypothetical protein
MGFQFSLSVKRFVILSGAPRHVNIHTDPMARSRRTPRILRHPCCIKAFLRGTGTIRVQIQKENFLKLFGLSKISGILLSAPFSEVDIRSAWRCVQDDRVINPLKSLTLSNSQRPFSLNTVQGRKSHRSWRPLCPPRPLRPHFATGKVDFHELSRATVLTRMIQRANY